LSRVREPAGPVARYYRVTCGEQTPVIESAVISGRAKMRIGGFTFPARFRFTHEAGRNYRHYIEAAVLGIPAMKVNEHYLDGHSRLELPFGTVENAPKIDMAANLGLWVESIWLPSIYLSDPRVRWITVDSTTAQLIVPFGQEEDAFTVTFASTPRAAGSRPSRLCATGKPKTRRRSPGATRL